MGVERLLNEYLPDEFTNEVDNLFSSVDEQVSKEIEAYAQKLNARADEFANGDFGQEFEDKLNEFNKDYSDQIDLMSAKINALSEKFPTSAAVDPEFIASLAQLKEELSTFQNDLNASKQKVQNFGKNMGSVLAKVTWKTITGGLG